ncbi:MAG TPA: hypothetical protein VFN55_15580 [Solirubrobacteraceae bacterium]|nr:hypothetical protein [Solirubrobacteraceae bacterium]
MSAAIPTAINTRLLAIVAAVVIAAAAAFTAISSASQPVVHAAVDRTGSVQVSGYDGGVSLTNKTP